MKSPRFGPAIFALALLSGIATSGCRSTFVVVPHPAGQYTASDTLYATHRGDAVRVTFRFDTIMRVDTVTRVDMAWLAGSRTIVRVDTLLRVDTVVRIDTIMRVDTLRVAVTDTVIRTVRVPGRRMLFVPPGHYPPEGQCRIWLHDVPPGQQASAAACNALGPVPAGAFVLFGGDAWDFDYDWIGEAETRPDAVPLEIVALKRRG
jgi:hypothetical protein